MKKRQQGNTFLENRGGAMLVGLLLSLLLLAFSLPLQAAVEVSASINARSFPIDRVATLTLTASGVRSFTPVLPKVDGLLFHRRGQSTQMSLVNGSYSSSVTSQFLVEATRTGSFTIPPIVIRNSSGSSKTQAISFEVTAAQSAVVQTQSQPRNVATTRLRSGEADTVAFLRLTPVKKKSYSGEVVPIQIKVYFRDGIQANLNTLPQLKGEGFVLEELSRSPEKTRELIHNTPYTVLTWNSSLSGIKEGEHTVSVELEATLLLRQKRRRAGNSLFNDPFMGGSFFDDFFGGYQEKEVKIASPAQKLTVLSLPEQGKPQGFSGAIGDFRLKVSASPLELSLGDPVTLNMVVSGVGNFARVGAPQMQQKLKGWKSYTPSSEFVEEGSAERGRKVFEQALVLKDTTVTAIPAMKFSYFDPDSNSYKTLRSDPIPIQISGRVQLKPVIAPTKQQPASLRTVTRQEAPGAAAVQAPLPALAPLKIENGSQSQELSPLFSRSWFQIVATLFLLIVLGAVLQRMRKARFARNPLLLRNQEMKSLLKQRLSEMEQARLRSDSRTFLARCRRAIQEQLGLLWGVEAAAITRIDLEQRLVADSILITVFTAADESAYGGQNLDSRQMQEFTQGLKSELEGLI